jgi:hypothetical protein
MTEGPAAAEAESIDHVEPEPASRRAQPRAARLPFRPRHSERPTLAEMRASKEPSPKARTLLWPEWKSQHPNHDVQFSSTRDPFGLHARPTYSGTGRGDPILRTGDRRRRSPPSRLGPLDPGWSKQKSIWQAEQNSIFNSLSFAQHFGLRLSEVNYPRQLDILGPY